MKLPKGIKINGNRYMLDFGYKSGRYRVTTAFLSSDANLSKAVKLLHSIKLDLERDMFLLVNYSKLLINPSSLQHLDKNYDPNHQSINAGDLIAQQLELYQNMVKNGVMEESTVMSYQYSINLHLLPFFGGKLINEVDAALIEQFVSKLNLSRERIKKILQPLREVIKGALRQKLIKDNPFNNFPPDLITRYAVKSDYEVLPFSREEISKILDSCDHDCIHNFIKFGFWTGMRLGEIFALEWSDIDFESETIKVNKTVTVKQRIKTTKTNAGVRDVEMTPSAKSALLAQFKITGNDEDLRIFKTAKGKTWKTTSAFGVYWRNALKKANIQYRNPYQMRHTFISYMLEIGNNPMILYKMVGHKNPQIMFNNYARFIKKGTKKLLKTE